MSLPAVEETWTIDPCNRIAYSSLVQVMREYLYGIKMFLVANGYAVVGSSDGTTAAIDSVDRWAAATDAGTRGANAASAQSWIVLRDGNGVDLLLAFQGASDDIARISFSPGQLFVAAGTATHQPTATDEQVVSSAVSLIGSTTSADRLWSGWVNDDATMCRFAVARSGLWVGRLWGVEKFHSAVVSPTVVTPAVWGFALTVNAAAVITLGTNCGVLRAVISSVGTNVALRYGMEFFGATGTLFSTLKPPAQGTLGYPMLPLSIGSVTTGGEGKYGNLIDVWFARSSGGVDGDTYGGGLEFIGVGGYGTAGTGAAAWPWDGATTPVMS